MLPINRVIFRRLGIAVGTWCLREIGCAEYDFCGLFFGRPATTALHTSPHSSALSSYCYTGIKNNTRTHVKSTKRFFIQTFFWGHFNDGTVWLIAEHCKGTAEQLDWWHKSLLDDASLGAGLRPFTSLYYPFATLSLPFSPFL